MSRNDVLRLLTRIARLYYEQNQTQKEIADQFDLSQARVSRLLSAARDEGIVRITVNVPHATHPELEERLESAFDLKEAIVVDSAAEDEDQLFRDIGAAAAFYVESTLKRGEVIGISSWSETLLGMVDAMNPVNRETNARVVQILGGVGNPVAEVHATQLVQRMGQLVKGKTVLLPTPGIVGTTEAKEVLLSDPFVRETFALMNDVTMALVGIGSLRPSSLITDSGNIFSDADIRGLAELGAVGDICQRFFDADGMPVDSAVNDRVIGMDFDQLKKVPRVVGAAGGERKLAAIRAAAMGGWVDVLVTDQRTAAGLIEFETSSQAEPEVTG